MEEQYSRSNRTGSISRGFILLLLTVMLVAGCSRLSGANQDGSTTQLPGPLIGTPSRGATQGEVESATIIATVDLSPLITQLSDTDPLVRISAAEALGQSGNAQVVEALIAALKDRDAEVRQAAALALGDLADPRAAQSLVELLKDPEDGVRMAAGYALEMAEAFLNCGNTLLKEAATTWAEEHGYTIVEGCGGGFPRWGSGG